MSLGGEGTSTAMTEIDYRRLFKDLPTPYMVLDTDLRFLDVNDHYLEATQRTRAELLGAYVFDAFPGNAEEIAPFETALREALDGRPSTLERQRFPIPETDGGSRRDVVWTCRHVPVHDEVGRVCGVVQHAVDVTQDVAAEQMRDAVSHEFAHRIKNLLATITVIARRTAAHAQTMDDFTTVFGQRIDAMARTHQLLVNGGWDGMLLSDLLEGELTPFRNEGRSAITLRGPRVMLTSIQAQALGMAFHELSTNAAKYGAFSDPNGRLDVRWVLEAGKLRIEWNESGLEGVKAPDNIGFGSRIIEEVTPMQVEGEVERTFTPNGMCCTIDVPMV
ncbi:PAS domain S-box-containing protein [Breoghania corrubedonensis]|uniref:Blue-light-activated histidine kinase n=1 Tax=Breoghania corrubedonensis TaxID=665038 RepID=A0A2T5V4R9_9HYPH|nr:HWE histidine kinase domain-containing protein [Breoghania corrubedonensis]PTW58748.1 PAS domain S-box-containing protein [Breoghania corrubedonensis]